MTVEPGERPWTRIQVTNFSRIFDDSKYPSPLNAFFAFLDRMFVRFAGSHYHFFTGDRELCGWRLQDGTGKLMFEVPNRNDGVVRRLPDAGEDP